MGITTHGELKEERTRNAFNSRVQAYIYKIADDTRQSNTEAAAFNARLGLTAADVAAIRDEAEHGEARKRAAARDATPIAERLPPASGIAMRDVKQPPRDAEKGKELSRVYRGMSARDLAQIRATHERERVASAAASA